MFSLWCIKLYKYNIKFEKNNYETKKKYAVLIISRIYIEGNGSNKGCCYSFVKQTTPLDTTMYQVLKLSPLGISAAMCVENCRKNPGCMQISFKSSNSLCVLFTIKTTMDEIPNEYIDDVEIYQRS